MPILGKNFDLDSALESSDSEESQPSSTNSNVKDTISSIDIYNNSNNNSLPILPTLALQSATQSIAKSADEISVPLTPTGTTSSNLSQTTDSIEKKRKPKSNSFIKSPRTDSKELNVENRSVSPKKRSPRKELKESKDGTGTKEKEKEKSKEKRDKDKKEKRDKRDKEAKTPRRSAALSTSPNQLENLMNPSKDTKPEPINESAERSEEILR